MVCSQLLGSLAGGCASRKDKIMSDEVKVVKSCDYSAAIAAKVFSMLNDGVVYVRSEPDGYSFTITTDTDPRELVYPEGWYFAKGALRNKHNSTTGSYSEIPIVNSFNEEWS